MLATSALAKRMNSRGADLYIYQTRNEDVCKIGVSVDHSKRRDMLEGRIRQRGGDWYFEYVWHKRFVGRSHALLVEQALKKPLSKWTIKPVSSDYCIDAGIKFCGEIFLSSDIEKIKRRVELLEGKFELLPHKELSFCSEQHIFRGPCKLLIDVRSGEMSNATMCDLTTAEVCPYS